MNECRKEEEFFLQKQISVFTLFTLNDAFLILCSVYLGQIYLELGEQSNLLHVPELISRSPAK